eukprot:COSAG03_NODE_20768_length_314_cov_0.711628_1_plen_32_part_01
MAQGSRLRKCEQAHMHWLETHIDTLWCVTYCS